MHTQGPIIAIALVLVVLGFLLPLWPLCVLGVLLAALSGAWASALILGLALDIAFGAPVGTWHFLYFPFTLLALIGVGAHYYMSAYVRRGSQNTL